jgi:hypothetical protein
MAPWREPGGLQRICRKVDPVIEAGWPSAENAANMNVQPAFLEAMREAGNRMFRRREAFADPEHAGVVANCGMLRFPEAEHPSAARVGSRRP